MYSSLPGASKLYACNTSKSKQKNAPKKFKKKITSKCNVSAKQMSPNHVETITLVSAANITEEVASSQETEKSECLDRDSFSESNVPLQCSKLRLEETNDKISSEQVKDFCLCISEGNCENPVGILNESYEKSADLESNDIQSILECKNTNVICVKDLSDNSVNKFSDESKNLKRDEETEPNSETESVFDHGEKKNIHIEHKSVIIDSKPPPNETCAMVEVMKPTDCQNLNHLEEKMLSVGTETSNSSISSPKNSKPTVDKAVNTSLFDLASEEMELDSDNCLPESDLSILPQKLLKNFHDFNGSTMSLKILPEKHMKTNTLQHANSFPENFKTCETIINFSDIASQNSSLLKTVSFEKCLTSIDPVNILPENLNFRESPFTNNHVETDHASVKTYDPPKSYSSSVENLSSICSQISSVLPPVTTKEARLRSYVVGSVRASGSLLGIEELVRYFPEKKVTLFVGTWNMNGQEPPECINDFLLPDGLPHLPDIYAVGVQESNQARTEWEILMQTTLGPSHVLFHSASVGVLHLAVFLRRDLIWFCSEPEDASVTTRPGSMVKTKGAIAISFIFFGTSFLFINSHLTAHEKKLKERLADYEKIRSMIDLPKLIPLKPQYQSKDVTSRFDNVFWCGDLNFRVVQDRPAVLSFVEEKLKQMIPTCEFLLQHDQLQKTMNEGLAFHGFQEGMINFVPSYKFDIGTNSFDSSKQRVPSYTDRVLYRCKQYGSVCCTHYNVVSEVLTSDHKPVYAVFEVKIKPGRDNIPLAAGLFKREIYLEANKRRAMALEVTTNHGNSTICSLM